MIIYFSLLVSLIGLLIYVLAGKVETKEIGRIMFAFGLLAFLLGFHGQGVGVLR